MVMGVSANLLKRPEEQIQFHYPEHSIILNIVKLLLEILLKWKYKVVAGLQLYWIQMGNNNCSREGQH